MEIKRIHDLYAYRPSGGVGRSAKAPAGENALLLREVGAEGDQINISPEASFRAKLDTASKRYAGQVKTHEASVARRVASLKEQYRGDNCPISGQDVAQAIMHTVLGGE